MVCDAGFLSQGKTDNNSFKMYIVQNRDQTVLMFSDSGAGFANSDELVSWAKFLDAPTEKNVSMDQTGESIDGAFSGRIGKYGVGSKQAAFFLANVVYVSSCHDASGNKNANIIIEGGRSLVRNESTNQRINESTNQSPISVSFVRVPH